MSEATRAWIYRVSTAALAVLVLYGVIGPDEVPVWAELAGAALGLGAGGLAIRNTSTKPKPSSGYGA